jgi:DNA repair protein SbcD/Mre11
MDFTFLHAADLHLGSPFVGLAMKDDTMARRFAAASREAFSELVTRAIEAKVAFVVIAGDVYDGEWKDTSIGLFFNREVARLDRAGIPLFLLKGNHDAESVVTKTISLPDSVSQFPTNKARTFPIEELKVVLHGRSFPDRAVDENYAMSYPAPVLGWFNIGVLHSSCDGRPGHEPYAPCTVQDLASRGYQYWALGHVHEFEVLARDPWIVFPGNLQGRSVRECGAKGAVLVDVADGHVTDVRRLIVDRARWAVVVVSLDGVSDEMAALRKIEDQIRPAAEQAESRLLALRVRLEGTTPLHRLLKSDPRRFSDEVQASAHRCNEDIWLECLRIETQEPHAATSTDEVVASIDLAAMLDGLQHDRDVRTNASALIAEITSKLPGGISEAETPLTGDLDVLLQDARALVLGRAMLQKR